jgi:hypothetical protein
VIIRAADQRDSEAEKLETTEGAELHGGKKSQECQDTFIVEICHPYGFAALRRNVSWSWFRFGKRPELLGYPLPPLSKALPDGFAKALCKILSGKDL